MEFINRNNNRVIYLTKNKENVYIGWSCYRFFEFVRILRFFRYWRFGHRADKFTRAEVYPLCNGSHKKIIVQVSSGNAQIVSTLVNIMYLISNVLAMSDKAVIKAKR